MSRIFVLNLGSTSSKIALFEDETMVSNQTFRHTSEELRVFPNVLSQTHFRKEIIDDYLQTKDINLSTMDLIVIRGAVTKPIPGGVYRVDEAVYDDISHERNGSHISNVGICIGYEWAKETGKDVVFVNAPMTDEYTDIARISGPRVREVDREDHGRSQSDHCPHRRRYFCRDPLERKGHRCLQCLGR